MAHLAFRPLGGFLPGSSCGGQSRRSLQACAHSPATLPACRCRPHAMEPPEPSPAHALRRLAALNQDDTPLGGAGGAVVDVLLMLLPLVFLVTVTISRRLYMPTSHSVPLAAAALYLFK